jgi:hypothetical protein
MYCKNCGTELNENGNFCKACGASKTEENPTQGTGDQAVNPETPPKPERDAYFYGTVITSAAFILFMLLDWIKIPGYSAFYWYDLTLKASYSLLGWAPAISGLNTNYFGGSLPTVVTAAWVCTALCVVCILLLGRFIYKLLKDFENCIAAGNLALIFSVVLSVIVIVVVQVLNDNYAAIDDLMNYLTGETLIDLAIFPYVIIVGAVVVKFVLMKRLKNRISR